MTHIEFHKCEINFIFIKLILDLHPIDAIVQFYDWLVVFVQAIIIFDVVNLCVLIEWLLKINFVIIVDSINVKMQIGLSVLTILKFLKTFLESVDNEEVMSFDDMCLD